MQWQRLAGSSEGSVVFILRAAIVQPRRRVLYIDECLSHIIRSGLNELSGRILAHAMHRIIVGHPEYSTLTRTEVKFIRT
jgi:hypothetical protein